LPAALTKPPGISLPPSTSPPLRFGSTGRVLGYRHRRRDLRS
jgi:hypothetical protein